MSKCFSILFFFVSFNCLANPPINCTNINGNTPKAVANILKYMCGYCDLNKINCITENTTILNDWIANGYFFIIDQTENVVLLPYEIFKKLLPLSYFGYSSDNLITDSSVISVAESSKISEISNISCLVKVPLNSINNFIAMNKHNNKFYDNWSSEIVIKGVIITIIVVMSMIFLCTCVNTCSNKNRAKNRIYNPPKKNIDIEKNSLKMREYSKL